MTEREFLSYLKEMLEKNEARLQRIEEKLETHIDRLARLEEQTKTAKGSISIILTFIITALGWTIYKARF